MASVLDVAEYILQKMGPISAMKLQKLVYYSQAWSLVWDDAPLFAEPIEAWANGPVVRKLYEAHRGQFEVRSVGGDPSKLNADQIDTIQAIIGSYGTHNSQWLSDLTHSEEPWKQARQGLSEIARSDREITSASMAEYYSSL